MSSFGDRLRACRRRRAMSQLDLAVAASTTPRYVSFIETGRSRPGVGVVLRLAEALQLSLRESNALLGAAGLPPCFPEEPLSDASLAPIRHVVDLVLANHEPFPAFAFGPGLRIIAANAAGERLFPGMTEMSPRQLVEVWTTPDPRSGREQAVREVYRAVRVIRREHAEHPHPDLPELLAIAEARAAALGPEPDLEVEQEVVLASTLRLGDRQLSTLSTVLRFDKSSAVAMEELRVELLFPADAATEAFFRSGED